MSLVLILNNGYDMVVATDKRIINTDDNNVLIGFTDNNKKHFITPQNYVITFNGDISNKHISIIELINSFVSKTVDDISINEYIIRLRDFIYNKFVQANIPFLNSSVQVSGINNYPVTMELKIENMEIVKYNNLFILCGSTNAANKEVEKIRASQEYKDGTLDMSISSMKSLAQRLMELASKNEVGRYGVCPVSPNYDIIVLERNK